jgi:uncharacterized protein YjhX (UPF0386 family)
MEKLERDLIRKAIGGDQQIISNGSKKLQRAIQSSRKGWGYTSVSVAVLLKISHYFKWPAAVDSLAQMFRLHRQLIPLTRCISTVPKFRKKNLRKVRSEKEI